MFALLLLVTHFTADANGLPTTPLTSDYREFTEPLEVDSHPSNAFEIQNLPDDKWLHLIVEGNRAEICMTLEAFEGGDIWLVVDNDFSVDNMTVGSQMEGEYPEQRRVRCKYPYYMGFRISTAHLSGSPNAKLCFDVNSGDVTGRHLLLSRIPVH